MSNAPGLVHDDEGGRLRSTSKQLRARRADTIATLMSTRARPFSLMRGRVSPGTESFIWALDDVQWLGSCSLHTRNPPFTQIS